MSSDRTPTLSKNIGSYRDNIAASPGSVAVAYRQSYCQQCHQHHQQQQLRQPFQTQQRCRQLQHHASTALPSSSSSATAAAAATTLCISGGGKLRWTRLILFLMLCSSVLRLSLAKQRFCGKSLNEAMDLLCVNGYNLKLSAAAAAAGALASSSEPSSMMRKRFVPFIMQQQTKSLTDNSQMEDVLFDNADDSAASESGSESVTLSSPLNPENDLPLTYASYVLSPFLSEIYNNIMAKTRRRVRRLHLDGGAYDECCRQPCTYSELSAYCRPA